MSDFSYDRQELRHETSIAEFDYEMVDPRTYLRGLKRDIQEVRTQRGYKYATEEPAGENPLITDEAIGGRSGRVEGRLLALTNWEKFSGTRTEEEGSDLPAILAAALGVVVTLVGLTMQGNSQGPVVGLGLVLLAGGGLFYYFTDPDVTQNEYYYRKRTRILVEGEVAERTADDADSGGIIASDLSVTCSENIEIEHRTPSGSQRMSRQELPSDIESQLTTGYTPITDEVAFGDATAEVYCQRTA